MPFLRILICAVASYLLGSINSGIIITKWFTGLDLRKQGSGNAGSTNAYRVLGIWPTLLVVLGDALKGVVAVVISWLLLGDNGRICAFMFVILGHVHPLFYNFKGGKGVLTTAAMVAVFDWRIAVILVLIFVIVVAVTRYVSLGSIIGVSLMPLFVYLFYPGKVVFTLCTMFISLWIVILHKDNLIRLKNGTESKITLKKHISVPTEQKPSDGESPEDGKK